MPGSGTDKTKRWIDAPGPIIILVEPQLGDNIGATARAMANFGLSRLRLVKPRDGWPNPRAWIAASGADRILDQATLHDTIETSEGVWLSPAQALEDDYHTVYATAQHLRRLSPFCNSQELLAFARSKPIRRVSPEVVEGGSGLSVFLPPDLVDSW